MHVKCMLKEYFAQTRIIQSLFTVNNTLRSVFFFRGLNNASPKKIFNYQNPSKDLLSSTEVFE